MSRLRLILLSVLAVFAVAGVASASASAVEFQICKEAGAGHKYESEYQCEQEELGAGNWEWVGITEAVKAEGISGPSLLSATVGGAKLMIECKKDSFAGTLESAGKSSKAVIKYEECAITGSWATKCEVETTLTTGELKDALSVVATRIVDTFEPEATNFISIVVKKRTGQTCSIETTYPITGSQQCEVDKHTAEAESGKLGHELICKTTGSNLKLGANVATYRGTALIWLMNRHYWRMK